MPVDTEMIFLSCTRCTMFPASLITCCNMYLLLNYPFHISWTRFVVELRCNDPLCSLPAIQSNLAISYIVFVTNHICMNMLLEGDFTAWYPAEWLCLLQHVLLSLWHIKQSELIQHSCLLFVTFLLSTWPILGMSLHHGFTLGVNSTTLLAELHWSLAGSTLLDW